VLVTPLSEKHLVELDQAVERALSQWLTPQVPSEPVAVVRALDRVLLFLKQNGDASAQARQVSSLAFAFGEQVVRAGGWAWRSVSEDGSVNPSIVRDADGRACLVVDTVTAMVLRRCETGLSTLFEALVTGTAAVEVPGLVTVATTPTGDAQARFERDVLARLLHLRKSARMWASPDELEAVGQHFTHVLLASRVTGWSFEQTQGLWATHGAPFAGDADEHASMRTRLWGEHLETARSQVALGFVSIWAGLDRDPEREPKVTPWLEALLDAPRLAGSPDRLNAVLFALMGFVAKDPQAYVAHLSREREHAGGHSLRPLHVVGPPGPTEAHLTYTRKFTSFSAVAEGIGRVVEALERGTAGPLSV